VSRLFFWANILLHPGMSQANRFLFAFPRARCCVSFLSSSSSFFSSTGCPTSPLAAEVSAELRISGLAWITLTMLSIAVLNWWRGPDDVRPSGEPALGEGEEFELDSLLTDGLRLRLMKGSPWGSWDALSTMAWMGMTRGWQRSISSMGGGQ